MRTDCARRPGSYLALAAIVVAARLPRRRSGRPPLVRAVVTALIMLVLVLGLNIFIGNSGVFSFGHMAFMAIGAYVTAVLADVSRPEVVPAPGPPGVLGDWHCRADLAVLVSGAVAAAFAAVLAVPLMRLSGLTASLATFAILIACRRLPELGDLHARHAGLILDADVPVV